MSEKRLLNHKNIWFVCDKCGTPYDDHMEEIIPPEEIKGSIEWANIFVHTTRMPRLEEDDIKSQTMGMSGEDIVLSPKAREMIPYCFECKNVERLQFWKTVEQVEANTKRDNIPAIVMKKNRKKPYVAIPLDHFITILKGK